MTDLLTLDFETFYSSEYSLDKLSTEAYIRDPRFKTVLCGTKFNDEHAFWTQAATLKHFFASLDWANIIVICHHAHFDGAILAWHYGIRPAMFIDTLSMSRLLDGPKAGHRLDLLAQRYGLPPKGDFVDHAKGKHFSDLNPDERHAYGAYCCNDVELTYQLAQIFIPQIPIDELRLIDINIRMFTEPIFRGNADLLWKAASAEHTRKIGLLRRIGQLCQRCWGSGRDPQMSFSASGPCDTCGGSGVDKKVVGSSNKFADLLRQFGVEPAQKLGKPNPDGSPKLIYAFARTDPAMQALLEDPEEEIRFLAEARIAVKSNIVETRTEKFAACAERGPMPVYLAHAGAHTFRPSGGDGMNWLNMSKHNAARPEMMVLRQSIQAPPGYKIVAADSSQGEARILAWLAGQHDLVQAFAEGRDVYSEHASTVYSRPVDRKRVKEDYIPGQLGKISILSMGFGAGWYKTAMELLKGLLGAPPIQFTAKDMETLAVDPSRFLNNPKNVTLVETMPSRLELNDRLIHCAVTHALVQRYRKRYECIPAYWDHMNEVINAMIIGRGMAFGAHGIMRTGEECIWMPNGLALRYRGLQRDDNGEATYFNGRERTRLHGPMLTENCVQSLHRQIVAAQLLEIAQAGIKVALWPYDEIVAVVPEDAADVALEFMLQTMRKAPPWATGLPLASEGGIGSTYAEC